MDSKIMIRQFSILLIAVFSMLCFSSFAADESPKEEITQSAVREEIQRYMGYEPLLQRYLSLPYDTSLNSNVQGAFVDISYLSLALLPVIFLLGFKSKPVLGIPFMLLLLVFLGLSVSNGALFTNYGVVSLDQIKAREEVKMPDGLVANVYQGIENACSPLNEMIGRISGENDHVTYPLLMLLFAGFYFLIAHRIKHLPKRQNMMIQFIYFFSFMWVLLTAGIVWYGYPIIALSLILVGAGLSKIYKEKDWLSRSLTVLSAGLIGLYLASGMIYRYTNYTTYVNDVMPKVLYDVGEINYQAGKSNKKEVFEGFFPGGGWEAMQRINMEDQSLIYRIGTVLPYFVKKNDRRVLLDNQLGIFYQLHKKYPNKGLLANILRSNDYKYIFVDLNTHTIDKTPEQTLRQKFIDFLEFCNGNPNLRLMATNRMVNLGTPQQPNYQYRVFGNMVQGRTGSYAIYEILDNPMTRQ